MIHKIGKEDVMKVISISNVKDGVDKTTTVDVLSAGLNVNAIKS